ncbi:MAG TPA: hypothetical protein VGN16_18540, partial [Acidobacteriaceae bacterium]
MRLRKGIPAGMLLVAMLSGCGPTASEKRVIADLTHHMKRVCIGRFVMNVPQSVALRGNVTLYYGLDKNFKTVEIRIEAENATPESMRTEMDARAKEIAEDKNWEAKKSMLVEYRVLDSGVIYLRKYKLMGSAGSTHHEVHMLMGTVQIELSSDSFEGLDSDPEFPLEPVDKVQARLFRIASQIRLTEDPEKAGPGFCLGPVVIDSDNDEEQASMGFRMSGYP